jgi:class 3 adenylate cyclase
MKIDEFNRPRPLERKLATILSADVAEYSRLMAEDEEQTLNTFRAQKQIFESLVALHRGRVFNTAGDAILAEFGSTVEAVRCATEVQAAIATRNDQLPRARQIRFRIGVNLGDVIVQGSDLLGDGVNIAARLQAQAEPGGICISGDVYDQIRNKLSLSFKFRGEQNYKNIPRRIRTYCITQAEDQRTLPGAPPLLERRGVAKMLGGGAAIACIAPFVGGAYWFYTGSPKPAAAPAMTAERPPAQRIAYVVGNSNYHKDHLTNPVRDADRVAEALEQKGFKVVQLKDLDRSAMVRAVEEFESTLAIVGGVGLFYYAGRAAYVNGDDILFPIDVKEDTARAEIVGGVNFTQLTKEVRTKTTQTITDNGFAVIYSASKGQKAADGPVGGISPFAQQFLNALAYHGDELSDLFRRIGQEMAHTTPRQTPFFEDARKVKFYFNKPEDDPRDGVIKILVFDSCRDNPFKENIVAE